MPTTKPVPARRALHVYLTEESFEAFHDFGGRHGVSVSGLLEVIGQSLAADHADDEWGPLLPEIRAVDAVRRRRRRS